MPRPADSPDVKTSKALAYILRHGAEKEGLSMRSDGYIKLNDVLSRPKLRGVDTAMVLRLVAENAKQRFELFYGIDPSPAKPKAKKGQGKGKAKQPAGKAAPTDVPAAGSSGIAEGATSVGPEVAAGGLTGSKQPDSDVFESAAGGESKAAVTGSPNEVDAATVDNLSQDLSESNISSDLPLIALPAPTDTPGDADLDMKAASPGEWFIRATQGHSIQLESVSHLTPVLDDEDGRKRAGVCVHGTRWELWDVLRTTGLSRMARTHIHLAPALSDHPILPRPNSTLRIYLDVPSLLSSHIPLYTSSNGVVLTPGNEQGVVEKRFWKLAERKVDGEWVVVLRDGTEME